MQRRCLLNTLLSWLCKTRSQLKSAKTLIGHREKFKFLPAIHCTPFHYLCSMIWGIPFDRTNQWALWTLSTQGKIAKALLDNNIDAPKFYLANVTYASKWGKKTLYLLTLILTEVPATWLSHWGVTLQAHTAVFLTVMCCAINKSQLSANEVCFVFIYMLYIVWAIHLKSTLTSGNTV